MEKKNSALKNLDNMIMAVMLSIITIVMILQVFARYVLNYPLIWSEEVARDMFIWMTMIGFSYNARTDNDIAMTLLVDKFSDKTKKILVIAKDFVGFGLFLFMIFPAVNYYKTQIPSISPTMLFSMGWIGISVPIGMVLATIQFGIHFVLNLKKFIKETKEGSV